MLIAKKIWFLKGETVDGERILTNFGESALYIPVSGYNRSEISDMWSDTSMIELLNNAVKYDLVGSGWPCLNPGVENGNIYETTSYTVFCNNSLVETSLCSRNSYFTGIKPDGRGNYLYYVNNPTDLYGIALRPMYSIGLFNGSSFDFSWVLNLMPCLGLGQRRANDSEGAVCFFICSSDGKFGFWRINQLSKSDSYLRWFTDAENEYFRNWLDSLESVPLDQDPFYGGGNSTEDEEPGDFDGSSDPIDFPTPPVLSATDTGFITVYNPTKEQLSLLSSYMWTNSLFDLDTWKKLFADPMDAILGLSIVPVAVPNAGRRNLRVGNIETPVEMYVATSQYVVVDCGSITVEKYSASYLDYLPYTKIDIFLPYIGVRQLSTDDIMGETIRVKYYVDIISGQCVAFIKSKGSLLYSFAGQCATMIPVTNSDYEQACRNAVTIATTVVSAGAGFAAGAKAASDGLKAIKETVDSRSADAVSAAHSIGSTVQNALGIKPQIQKSGVYSGSTGIMGPQKPYLIITRPVQCLPKRQNELSGYPSYLTDSLSNFSGFTIVDSIHLEGIPCTDSELTEIENILKGGVIL